MHLIHIYERKGGKNAMKFIKTYRKHISLEGCQNIFFINISLFLDSCGLRVYVLCCQCIFCMMSVLIPGSAAMTANQKSIYRRN